jgi:hypothetical protein
MLKILDSISDPGNPHKPNDDRVGHNADCAFVIDGATGLADRPVMTATGSDAAWLAERAKAAFELGVTRKSDLGAVVAAFSAWTAADFAKAAKGPVPRYAWPSASFAMLRARADGWAFAGLGDCTLFLADAAGNIRRCSALPDHRDAEQHGARAHIALTGGFGRMASFHAQPETLDALRAARERQNTAESGVWTLGLVPEAASHIVTVPIAVDGLVAGLLCSDGFADLVDLYGRYSPLALIEAARERGLAALVAEIRDIELRIDPDGHAYPRFKQSDDASAVLFELADRQR